MRWRWVRGSAPDRVAEPSGDTIDTVDLDTLEVIELDREGRLVGRSRPPGADTLQELAERPSRRDPTGTAGIWEALAHS